jgi:radical SAM superfamily enzyme YgiQ (UPF0313 family)
MRKTHVKSRTELLKDELWLDLACSDNDNEPIALVYPNDYKVGMASLAYLTLYRYLKESGFTPERFFFDIRNQKNQAVSLETGTPLRNFNKIAFHFSYELDYVNALSMLINSGIEVNREEREKKKDIVILAGGIAVTANSLPLANYFDAFFIGEIEDIGLDILKGNNPLMNISESSDEGWFVSKKYKDLNDSYRVSQKYVKDLNRYQSFSPIVTPNSIFGKINLVEISRGCRVRCKFCLTGEIYGKIRERSLKMILGSAMIYENSVKKIGLIAPTPSNHPEINQILKELLAKEMTVSLSSVSVASLNSELISLLVKCGMKTLTLGVESFDENLQSCYGKPIPFEMLISVLMMAIEEGFREIKFYLMLGLPGSKPDEVKKIAEKLICLNEIVYKKRPGTKIQISLNPFIPKIITRYEKEEFMGESAFRASLKEIKGKIGKTGIRVSSESHRGFHLQNILSRGDENAGEVLLAAARNENWKKISREKFPDEEEYLRKSSEKIGKIYVR